MVEQQGIGMQVLHLLEALLQQRDGHPVEGHRVWGRASGGGLFGQRGHLLQGLLVGQQIPGHLGCGQALAATGSEADGRRHKSRKRGPGVRNSCRKPRWMWWVSGLTGAFSGTRQHRARPRAVGRSDRAGRPGSRVDPLRLDGCRSAHHLSLRCTHETRRAMRACVPGGVVSVHGSRGGRLGMDGV